MSGFLKVLTGNGPVQTGFAEKTALFLRQLNGESDKQKLEKVSLIRWMARI